MAGAAPVQDAGRDSTRELVSVVIPLWNARDYVRATVESALRQTYRPIEVLVIDDGSTDGSRETIEDLIRSGDVRYVRQTNGGVSSARNRGIQEARGRYLAFLDSDDIWGAEKLERQVCALTEAKASACYCGFQTLNEATSATMDYASAYAYRDGWIAASFLGYSSWCWICTLVVERQLVMGHSLRFTPGWSRGEDIEFVAKVFMLTPVACVPQTLATYRIRGGSLSDFNSTSHLIGEVAMWERLIDWIGENRDSIPAAYDVHRLRRMISGFDIPYAVAASMYRFQKAGRRADQELRGIVRQYGRLLLGIRAVNGRRSLRLMLLLARLAGAWVLGRMSLGR